jgi:hypothetical protein
MLENQQSQLVTGPQELFKRVQNGQGWPRSPLKKTSHGGPLIHDILERLGTLKQENHGKSEHFGEDLLVMQQRLISSGAGYMQRSNSTDSDSETDQSPVFEQMPSRRPELMTAFGVMDSRQHHQTRVLLCGQHPPRPRLAILATCDFRHSQSHHKVP